MSTTGKKTRTVIGKLITPRHRCGVTETSTSPRPPSELKILSPRGVVNCDVGRVGLGIVAALETSGEAKKSTFRCRNPIPVKEARKGGVDEESLEEGCTIVTRHIPNEISPAKEMKMGCVFDISPARVGGGVKGYPDANFLDCCDLCKKKLHGKDIYMYRGEKAFCSVECRWREMGIEERREKRCSSPPCSHGHMFSTGGIFAI